MGQSQKLIQAGTKFITLSLAFYQFFVHSLNNDVVACSGIFVIYGKSNWLLLLVFILLRVFRHGDCPNVDFRPRLFHFLCAPGKKNFSHSHRFFQR